MKNIVEMLRAKYDPELPNGWELSLMECLPLKAETFTHVRLVGSIPRLLESGPKKGEKTWRDRTDERTFIVGIDEVRAPKKSEAQEAALQDLADQAQELNLGYES